MITFKVEIEQEDDGRWLAEVVELPGVLAYGDSQEAAVSKVQALALRVLAERLEHGEAGPELEPLRDFPGKLLVVSDWTLVNDQTLGTEHYEPRPTWREKGV